MKTWLQLATLCCAVMVVACGDDEVSTAIDLPEGPQLINPGFLAFKLTAPNGSTISQIPIVNNGNKVLELGAVSIAGQDAGRFTVGQPIETSVRPRSATSIPVTFRPNAVGAYVASVTIISNDANIPAFIVDLVGPSGVGNDPNLQVADRDVTITIPGGDSEARGVVRYYNVGRDSLVVTGYTFTGPGAASFSLADGTPSPGKACTVNGLECDLGLFCNLENADDATGNCALSVPVADPVVLDIYYAGVGQQTATFRITTDGGSPGQVNLTGKH